MTTIEKTALVYVTYIKTTPEKLWEALTKPDFIQKYWYGRRNETDLRVGGKIQSFSPEGEPEWHGEVLKCEPPNVLSYTFDTEDEAPSRVTFEIARTGDSVGEPLKLTITHDEFIEDSAVREKVSNGWPGIVAGIKTLLETGQPLGIEWKCASGN